MVVIYMPWPIGQPSKCIQLAWLVNIKLHAATHGPLMDYTIGMLNQINEEVVTALIICVLRWPLLSITNEAHGT